MKTRIYKVKVKITKEPSGSTRYIPRTITGLVVAKNPTQSAEAAKNKLAKAFGNEKIKMQIVENKTVRHDYIIDATKQQVEA